MNSDNSSKISIIIPIYNVAAYLSKCIISVVGQTYKDLEIILVDDASTDGSSDICDDFAALDKRIRVIHKEKNEGLVAARKTGICEASGDLIGYVDGDDWIEPDMYEVLYELLIDNEADMSVCSRYNDFPWETVKSIQGISGGVYDLDSIRKEILPKLIVREGFFEWGLSPALWDKLYRREVIEPAQMGVEDALMMGEDAAVIFPLVLTLNKMVVSHRCLYHYRQSDSSMVKISANDCKDNERRRFKALYQSVKKKFEKLADIYDMSDQWLKYVLFLMIPRSDVLYDGFDKLDYLFPFYDIKRGDRVVVYCAGLYGQRLFDFLKRTGFCKPVAMVDRDAGKIKGVKQVVSPKELENLEFDSIAVASSFDKTRTAIVQDLKNRFPKKNICGFDYEHINNRMTLEALGIL